MSHLKRFGLLIFLIFLPLFSEAKIAELSSNVVKTKLNEIMKAHASHKKLTPELVKRILQNNIEELDPNKTYFIESDIEKWLTPSDQLLEKILSEYQKGDFDTFEEIHLAMVKAVERRHQLEAKIDENDLPKHVAAKEFKDMKWTTTPEELLNRLKRIRSLQIETAAKLNEELKDKSLQRIKKVQTKYEESLSTTDLKLRKRLILSNFLKAAASSLDAHTAYFTPDEAAQFLINVQQRLFGIGAQLRDDLNGFSVVKIIEGGPAAVGKELKVKDRIIAVNGEPVVGMDIIDAVDLIRGEENTPVKLTIIRETQENDVKTEEKMDINILRGQVVLKESRYESSYEPYGNGVIGYIKLYSFYQDPESSSGADLANEIEKLKAEHKIKGIILDLRYNTGGMLSQAVAITGLFIKKGIVVSIKDDVGEVQHLRNLEDKTVWDGPLIVLINRASASASEIVAGTLQDYGRALVVGDENSYGKGSFQTFTLNNDGSVNPQGEYKVTRGRYYTVSGRTPQLTGVHSDIVVKGALSEIEIGEKFGKYPLESDRIKENFDDDLSDIPFLSRERVRLLYRFNLQPRLNLYNTYLETLRKNSDHRIANNKNYQNFLKDLKKNSDDVVEDESADQYGQNDLQLIETYNIMKDLILLNH